jgi:hypothetical protein
VHDALYPITRHGALEDAWFDLTYVAIREPDGSVGGILATVVEKTATVLAGRPLQTLHHVSNQAAGAKTRQAALNRALGSLTGSEPDVPFALGYLLDVTRSQASLAHSVGVEPGGPMAPWSSRLVASLLDGGVPSEDRPSQRRDRGHVATVPAWEAGIRVPLPGRYWRTLYKSPRT